MKKTPSRRICFETFWMKRGLEEVPWLSYSRVCIVDQASLHGRKCTLPEVRTARWLQWRDLIVRHLAIYYCCSAHNFFATRLGWERMIVQLTRKSSSGQHGVLEDPGKSIRHLASGFFCLGTASKEQSSCYRVGLAWRALTLMFGWSLAAECFWKHYGIVPRPNWLCQTRRK